MRYKCPNCRHPNSVRRTGATKEQPTHNLSEKIGAFRKLFREYALVSWSAPEPHLRRCLTCFHHFFCPPRGCDACGARTVGIDPVSVYAGDDLRLQRSPDELKKARSRAVKIIVSISAMALAALLYLWIWHTFLLIVTGSGIIVLATALSVLLLVWNRKQVLALIGGTGSSKSEGALRPKLDAFSTDAVEPFLSRNMVLKEQAPVTRQEDQAMTFTIVADIGSLGEVIVSNNQLRLLTQMFTERCPGLSGPVSDELVEDGWHLFLTSCALRRDFNSFNKRFEHIEQQHHSMVDAFAHLIVDREHEALFVPFLQQLMVSRGSPMEEGDFLARLNECRAQHERKAFAEDLKSRQMATGLTLTIEMVDKMKGDNFENLLAMIYASRGYTVKVTPKGADQGADVFADKAGMKTVIQAKRKDRSIGNDAVQEAVSARGHYDCHKAVVATNSTFSRSARELAASNQVELVDRAGLSQMIEEFNRAPKDDDRLLRLLIPRSAEPGEPAPSAQTDRE